MTLAVYLCPLNAQFDIRQQTVTVCVILFLVFQVADELFGWHDFNI